MQEIHDIHDILITKIKHSRFNTRKTRNDKDIQTLAERIKRIGFERTRALWVTENIHNEYEVFAGGTRFESAKLAGLETVPVLVHVNYSNEEISRLSDQDNENDEYHRPVLVTDVWAEYARLHEKERWTQEKIAEAKGVAKSLVSERISWYHLPNRVKKTVLSGDITEAHLRRIYGIVLPVELSGWLTTEQAIFELTEKAVHDKKKNGGKSVRALEINIASWKEWIAYAEKVNNSLKEQMTFYNLAKDPPEPYIYKPREEFIQELVRRNARSLSAVREAELSVRRKIADGLDQYHRYLEEKSAQAVIEKAKAEKVAALMNGFKCGNAKELITNIPDGSVRLLLTDPPYGMNYQSNRRWASESSKKMIGDEEGEAFVLLSEVIQKIMPKLTENAHALVFCSWRGEPRVREILEKSGFTIKGSLIWIKEEHSAGDIKGAFAPCHERIVHAVKGNPEVSPRKPDVFHVSRAKREIHPTEKPVELLKQLIKCTTSEGDLILDPFAGSGSTCLGALEINRNFVAFEIDEEYYEKACERLSVKAGEETQKDVRIQSGAA